MRDFFKSRSFKVLAGVVLVLLGVMLFTAATGRSFLSSLMGFVTTPVQQISSQAAGAAGAVGPSGKTIEELEAENAELKEKLNQMIALTVDYYDIKREKRAECQIPGAEGAEKGLPVRAGLCDRQRPGGSVLRLYHRSGLLVRD